jgi:hypothetical protein
MAEATKPTPGEITVMAGGAVALIASFLDFIGAGGEGANSWSSRAYFPLGWLIALFAVLVAVQVALARFANLRTEPKFAGLTWLQIDLMFAFFAVVLVVAWLIVDLFGADRKIGYWGMAIGAIAVFVGTILMVREGAATPGAPPPSSAPPPPPSAPPEA